MSASGVTEAPNREYSRVTQRRVWRVMGAWQASGTIRSPAALVILVIVAVLHAAVIGYAATGVASPIWDSTLVVDGVVTGIYPADGVIYIAVSGNGSSYIYTLDPDTGRVLWGATLEGSYPMVRALPDMAIVATSTGTGGLMYRVEAGQASLLVNGTVGRPSVRITAAAPTASGILVMAGGKYHVVTGIDVYLAGYTSEGMQWNMTTQTPGDQYLNTLAVGGDDTVCAAGPDGNSSAVLVCVSPSGKMLRQESYTSKGRPMAIAVYDKDNYAIALYNNGNTTLVVYRDGAQDEVTLEDTVITAITYTGRDKLAMTGATGGAPILIEVEYTSAGRIGNVYAIQGVTGLAPLAIAHARNGYLIGGEANGAPVITLLEASIQSRQGQQEQGANTTTTGDETDYTLLMVSTLLVAASTVILAYAVYQRRKARANPDTPGAEAGNDKNLGGQEPS